MNYLVIDTESTGGLRESKGSALDPRNRLCYVGLLNSMDCIILPIEYEVGRPYSDELYDIQRRVAVCDILVFFNAKHDLHWLRRYKIKFQDKPIWDCQLAEFILHGQTEPFPDLDATSKRYGAEGKEKNLEEEYYRRGKDTCDIPQEVLETYLRGDLRCTEQTFLGQTEFLREKKKLCQLILLNCQDELITQEMEWNGIKVDLRSLQERALQLESRIIAIDNALFHLVGDSRINWDSPLQVGTVLYGGEIIFKSREDYLFTYKDVKKQPVIKSRVVEKSVSFPRLVEPLPRTETLLGTYSTDTRVLQRLKAFAKAKSVVELILERRGNQTQIDRYFRGIPTKYRAMGWQDEIIHGQLHHCVAITGRLSSSQPNLQNIDERARSCLTTRFRV